MDSAIIAKMPIVDCRAFVEVVFSTSQHAKDDPGFFYNLNVLLQLWADYNQRGEAASIFRPSAASIC